MTVKIATSRNHNATGDQHKLSMRAAREAQNGLAVTLANVKSSTAGLTELDAEGRLQRTATTRSPTTVRRTPWCNCCKPSTTPSSMC